MGARLIFAVEALVLNTIHLHSTAKEDNTWQK